MVIWEDLLGKEYEANAEEAADLIEEWVFEDQRSYSITINAFASDEEGQKLFELLDKKIGEISKKVHQEIDEQERGRTYRKLNRFTNKVDELYRRNMHRIQ